MQEGRGNMADPHIQTVMERIETELKVEVATGQSLAFMVGEPNAGIKISDSPPEDERRKTYKRYLIDMYPDPDSSLEETPRLGNRVKREMRIGFSVWKKSQRKRKFIFFSSSIDTTQGTGIAEFVNLIWDVLRNNTLNGLVQLKSGRQFTQPTMEETDSPLVGRQDFVFMAESLQTIDSDGVP